MAVRIPQDTSYGLSQALIGVSPAPIISVRNPTVRDRAQLGQMWINRTTGLTFFLARIAGTTNTWYGAAAAAAAYTAAGLVTGGTGLLATTGAGNTTGAGLQVDANGANITGLTVITGSETVSGAILAGTSIAATTGPIASGGAITAATTATIGTGLTVTAGGATITAGGLTVTAGNAVITAGTFTVSAGLTTLAATTIVGAVAINAAGAAATRIGRAGTGLLELGNITGATSLHGLDVAVKVGDAAGVNEFQVLDSAAAKVASIDSNGNLFVAGDIEITNAGPQICTGVGAPGILVKPVGTIYIDSTGVTDATIYVRITGGTWEALSHI